MGARPSLAWEPGSCSGAVATSSPAVLTQECCGDWNLFSPPSQASPFLGGSLMETLCSSESVYGSNSLVSCGCGRFLVKSKTA